MMYNSSFPFEVLSGSRGLPELHQAIFELLLIFNSKIDDYLIHTLGITNLVTKPVGGKTLTEAIGALFPAKSAGFILIVDDDPQALELYRGMVAQGLSGYPISTAPDGAKALEMMKKEPPSLVILDLIMPGMDGFAVLEWMRANPSTRSVPVLILSGRSR